MSYEQWLIFLTACTLLNIAPGPDTMYITARTISQGRWHGLVASLGVCTGAMVHAMAAGAGLSVILTTSTTAFTFVKWVGAIFLICLGIRTILATHQDILETEYSATDLQNLSLKKVYIQAILVDILNPKTALFFLAFIPQFIDDSVQGDVWPFIFLGLVVITNALVLEVIWVIFAARISRRMRSNQRLQKWMERSLGLVLILLGLKLIREKS